LDNVDKIIWVLPVLAFLDVFSTLYIQSLGYSLAQYESGAVARIFINAGLIYVYIVIYPLVIIGMAYVLWYIKNKKLDSSYLLDRVVFLLLIGVTCFIYIRLTAAFIGNFLVTYFVSGKTSPFSVALLTYISIAFTLTIYLWRNVLTWVKSHGEKKEQ